MSTATSSWRTCGSASGTLKKTLSRTFDELGRMLKSIGALSQEGIYAYNKNDRVTSCTDPLGNPTAYAYDALNRVITVTDALTHDANHTFNATDQIASVTDKLGNATSFVRNGFGEVIRRTSPDTGVTDYVYDSAGNLTSMTDARGVVTDYAYDNLNRRTSKTFPGHTAENVTYTYDSTASGNFGIGRLTGIADESGSTAIVYDARGDVVQETRTIGIRVYTTKYAYNAARKLVQIEYPSGRTVDYVRDAAGRVSSVSTRKSPTTEPVVAVWNVQYLPFGPIAGMSFGNGLATTFSHDQDYRLTAATTSGPSASVQDLDYDRDLAGNVTAITDLLQSARNQTFEYDDLHRLVDAAGPYGNASYTYDSNDNRLTQTVGMTVDTHSHTSGTNRLSTVTTGGSTRTFGYDAAGNVTSDSLNNLTFVYDHDNRLAEVKQGGATVALYKHNDMGQRVVKDLGGVATHYHYDLSGALIAESDGTGGVMREYLRLGSVPIGVVDAAAAIAPSSVSLDNGASGTSSTGTWLSSTTAPGYLGADYAEANGDSGVGRIFMDADPPVFWNVSSTRPLAVRGQPRVECDLQRRPFRRHDPGPGRPAHDRRDVAIARGVRHGDGCRSQGRAFGRDRRTFLDHRSCRRQHASGDVICRDVVRLQLDVLRILRRHQLHVCQSEPR